MDDEIATAQTFPFPFPHSFPSLSFLKRFIELIVREDVEFPFGSIEMLLK